MDPHVSPYMEVLEDLRRQLTAAVDPLSDDEVNRTVPGLRNSIAILLRHVTGSERYWIGEVAGGQPAHRNRDTEFAHTSARKADLLADFERVAAQSRAVLERLSRDDLLIPAVAHRPRGTEHTTKAGAVLHAGQHLAYHLGQIRYLVTLLRPPAQ